MEAGGKEPQWPGYIMFTGLLCIIGSILISLALGPELGYSSILAGMRYFGFALIVVGFLIFVTVE